jgi:predicted nucleic acid-binding protein
MALVLDTGVLYSALDRNEPGHLACRLLLEATDEEIVIPSPVLPEVDYFIGDRLHPGVLISLLRDIQLGSFRVVDLEADDYFRIEEIVAQYADSNIGFVDAAVLAIVERLNEPKLATLDRRHFAMLRPRHVESLTLLPE